METLSRLNPRQADVITKFLVKMIKTLNVPFAVLCDRHRHSTGQLARPRRVLELRAAARQNLSPP